MDADTLKLSPTSRLSPSAVRSAAVLAVLLLIAAAAFWPATRAGFVFDDRGYIQDNEVLRDGLSAAALRSYLLEVREANWHPLAWLSHALDVRFFGLNPGAHHAVSLLLHLANGALLFLFLERSTASLWSSATAAALFAVHPLRVESVAWVAQRKDLLAGLFLLLTLHAYLAWARRPGAGRFLAVAALFALGLMAKQTLVTLPLALLLLDWWPLGRWGTGASQGLQSRWWPLAEKLPLLALAFGGGALALWAQASGEALRSQLEYPISLRVANAVVSYATYLGKTVWPVGLSVFYPYPAAVAPAKTAAAALLLGAASVAAWRLGKRVPAATAGWFWFVLTLLPLAGLIQVGDQAMADRYTYLPHIGLCVAAAWLLGWTARRLSAVRAAAAALAVALALLAGAAHLQTQTWRDELSLFTQALRAEPTNALAHFKLAFLLNEQGLHAQAESHYRAAVQSRPEYAWAHHNLAVLLRERGALDEAVARYREALRINPVFAEALYGLGVVCADRGRWEEAIGFYRQALRVRPDYPEAHNNVGVALTKLRRFTEAQESYRRALRLRPDFALASYNLGAVLVAVGRQGDAKRYLVGALAADPGLRQARELLDTL